MTIKGSKRVLGLPVDSIWATWLSVLATAGYYYFSKYPDLSVWDSPLIALVAIQGGLGHPPGYPLHTLLGAILSHLPGVDPLTGVKLLSIIPGALICIPILSIASQMADIPHTRISWPRVWLSSIFVICICIHPLLWGPSTRVEVYSLASFLATWGVARLCSAMEVNSPTASSGVLHRGGFYISGLSLGASAAVNPVVAAITATASFKIIVNVIFQKKEKWRIIVKIMAGGFTGLLLYLWVPIVGGRTDRLVWGAPTTPASIWDFLSAKDYATNVGPTASEILEHLYEWIGWSVNTGTLFYVALCIAGWFLFGKNSRLGRVGPIALVLAVLAICNNKVWLPENPDYLGYLCGPIAICAAGGSALLSNMCDKKSGGYRAVTWTCLGFVLLITFFAPPSIFSRSRHLDRSARLQAAGALVEAPQNGILLIGSDHLVWPVLYIQEIEKIRRDVVILTPGLVNSSWYWKRLYKMHPDLQPFDLNGPGGRYGRIRRFLSKHKERRLGFESVTMAHRVGVDIQGVGWLILDRAVAIEDTEKATAAIEQAAATIGTGSYNGVGTLSLVSYLRGQALWHLGQTKTAYRALLAGVPPSMRPTEILPDTHWEKVPALRIPIPAGTSITKGLGEPRRNLSIARYLVAPEKIEELKKLQSANNPGR